jgi:hypothetical protein
MGLLLFSCKSKGPKEKDVVQNAPVARAISGNFHYLQCTKAEFDVLIGGPGQGNNPKGNVVFKYFIQDSTFAFKGWEIKSNSPNWKFDSLPGISFKASPTNSPVPYGNATSLGDFILFRDQVNAIKKALKDRTHDFVVFLPVISGGELRWDVGTSMGAPKTFREDVDPVENAMLRPIPPYRYDVR